MKWIHVVSATVLFGTGIGTAFYMFMANRRGEAAEIHAAARTVVLADFIFTAPSAFVQLVTGVMLVQLAGYSFFGPLGLAVTGPLRVRRCLLVARHCAAIQDARLGEDRQ